MKHEENYFPAEHDLFYLTEQAAKKAVKPKLYMWCGTGDYLYADNVRLKEHIEKLDLDYTYEESPGSHCWDYWDVQIQRVLEWMFKN